MLESAGSLTIRDTAHDGRVLLTREDERTAVVGVPPGGSAEHDLSWFDNAGLAALSDDGRRLLFGDRFGIFLRDTDGAPATKLGAVEGFPDDLSPDGSTVLATNMTATGSSSSPTDPGTPRTLASKASSPSRARSSFPTDGGCSSTGGAEARPRSYVVVLSGGRPGP